MLEAKEDPSGSVPRWDMHPSYSLWSPSTLYGSREWHERCQEGMAVFADAKSLIGQMVVLPRDPTPG